MESQTTKPCLCFYILCHHPRGEHFRLFILGVMESLSQNQTKVFTWKRNFNNYYIIQVVQSKFSGSNWIF